MTVKQRVRVQWTDGLRGMGPVRLRPVTRIQFMGCAITAYAEPPDDEVWLDVTRFAEYLRDVDGLCAFCHGDPCGENSPPRSLIMREIAACPSYAPFVTCPNCQGRAT